MSGGPREMLSGASRVAGTVAGVSLPDTTYATVTATIMSGMTTSPQDCGQHEQGQVAPAAENRNGIGGRGHACAAT